MQEGAVLYDRDGGSIDVIASGGRDVRARIAQSFADNMLCLKGTVRPVAARKFSLERLRQQFPFDTDAADGIKAVQVTLIRLAHVGGRYERVTIEVDPADRVDIWTRSRQWFGDTNPLIRPEWRVTHAAVRIVFHPGPSGKHEGIVKIELRAPNGSNLRDQMQRHQIISQKYLARWGLVA